jgi:hypothetical protein
LQLAPTSHSHQLCLQLHIVNDQFLRSQHGALEVRHSHAGRFCHWIQKEKGWCSSSVSISLYKARSHFSLSIGYRYRQKVGLEDIDETLRIAGLTSIRTSGISLCFTLQVLLFHACVVCTEYLSCAHTFKYFIMTPPARHR